MCVCGACRRAGGRRLPVRRGFSWLWSLCRPLCLCLSVCLVCFGRAIINTHRAAFLCDGMHH